MSTKASDFGGNDNFHILARIDMSGILMKKSFGAHHSSKWSKKFFILKDGYLLYYNESEKKSFDKKAYLNIHPKGVLPLGGCSIDGSSDSNQDHILYVRSDDFKTGFMCLSAETGFEKEKWLTALQEASRITLKNARLGEDLIRELETRGLKLSKERQDCFDKLQIETMALREEIDRNDELERVKMELDEEKKKLENLVQEMKDDHSKVKKEYENTIEVMKSLETEKEELKNTTDVLHQTLEELSRERQQTITALNSKEQENQSLSKAAQELQQSLFMIEEETKLLLHEKLEIEKRFAENAAMSRILKEEKEIFSNQANHLLSSLHDLMSQKEMTEMELKEEIIARIHTEKRLFDAETSLISLEDALKKQSNKKIKVTDLCDKVLPHVQNLKRFFERAAAEAKIEANMPLIMKNAILARKSFIQKHHASKLRMDRQEKAKTFGVQLDNSDESFVRTLHRSYSTVGKIRVRPKTVAQLRRSLSTRIPKHPKDCCESHSSSGPNSLENVE